MKELGKGREFEDRMKQLAAPAPDPRARARAKDAALAEFARVHAAANESVVAPGVPGRPGFFARLAAWLAGREVDGGGARPGWRTSAILGGLASVFVAVFGLMSIWPMVTGTQPIPSLEDAAPATAAPPASVADDERAASAAPGRSSPVETAAAAPEAQPSELRAQSNARADARPEPRASDGPRVESAPVQGPATLARAPLSLERKKEKTTEADRPVITGFRAEGADASEAPRPAPAGVGAATAPSGNAIADTIERSEDMGALPETNVAESLRRRPKVSTTRSLTGYVDMNPVQRTANAKVSTFSVDVDTISYRAVRNQLNSGVLPSKESVRIEELINYFDYSWPLPQAREQPFEPTVIVSDSPWASGKKLVHIGIKGFQLDAQRRPDANVVMLIDASDSMDDIERLPLVRESMRLMLASLKPTDTVAIVVYASASGVVLDPTPVSERQKIWQALETLKPAVPAAPGTPGIKLAYDVAAKHFLPDGINRVLMCTDSNFSAGAAGSMSLRKLVEREREKGIFLSVLSFGMGEYRDERAQALAKRGNGIAAYVDDVQDARRVLVEQATGTLFTIAKDVRIQVEFNPATVAEWRLVGYEARELKGGGSNDDSVNAGDVGSGHTATAIYEITPVGADAGQEESRYAPRAAAAPGRGAHEYGYLKIRYKLPGGFRVRVIEQPIGIERLPLSEALRRDVEFSTAVAGFAQLLRGGRYTGGLTYDDVVRQAESARGPDPQGYRAEFVRLVRQAQRAGSERR